MTDEKIQSRRSPWFMAKSISFDGHVCAPWCVRDVTGKVPGRFWVGTESKDAAVAMLETAYETLAAAQAEIATLREALERIATSVGTWTGLHPLECGAVARAALATAGSPE